MRLVKSINVSQKLDSVAIGSGTFKEIIDNVYAGKIQALTDNNDNIIGINYESGLSGIEDSFEKAIFEKKYMFRPIMQWCYKAFQMYMQSVEIAEVIEDGYNVKVIAKDGSEIIVTEIDADSDDEECEDDYDCDDDAIVLSLEDDLDGDASLKNVRHYLKKKYKHCLAKGSEPVIDIDGDDVYVNDIEWGRKLSNAEYEAL